MTNYRRRLPKMFSQPAEIHMCAKFEVTWPFEASEDISNDNEYDIEYDIDVYDIVIYVYDIEYDIDDIE